MYTAVIVLHVVVAILGVGQVGGLAVAVSAARRAGIALPQAASWLAPLLRYTRVSLGLMVLSGFGMDLLAKGGYHGLWWVRLSVILTVIAFAFQHRAARALKQANAVGLERSAWSMCAAVAAITVLMEAKPF